MGPCFFDYIIPIFAIVSRIFVIAKAFNVFIAKANHSFCGQNGQTDGHIKAFRSSVLLPKGTKRTSIN